MKDSASRLAGYRTALKVLHSMKRSLVVAGATEAVLIDLSAILSYLDSLPVSDAESILLEREIVASPKKNRPQDLTFVRGLSDSAIEAIISSSDVSRKLLEEIAVERFHVPRGSVRSFKRIEDLREKISTLIRNARAHQTIVDVVNERKVNPTIPTVGIEPVSEG